MPRGFEPIASEEVLLRRVHWQYLTEDGLSPKAFRPTKDDTHGISLFRELYLTPEQVVQSARKPGTTYYVARLRAERILELGVTLRPDEPHEIFGHCVVPELHFAVAESEASQELMARLERRVIDLIGPFIA